ncbi:MAG TPA: glycosyltransferase [Solirubrobacteraceae bacterium]|jgi:glycosyltransferase involved in cell wall biosynthesis
MRDLLVTTHTPALGTGQALRTYGLARALSLNGGLDLLYVRFGAQQPDAAFSAIPDIRLHALTPSRGAQRALGYARARLHGVPAGFARGISPELSAEAKRLAAATRASRAARQGGRGGSDPPARGPHPLPSPRVIADGPIAAAALAGLARHLPVIYNAHNLESGFRHELDRSPLARVRAFELRRFERKLLARAAESWMVSEADIAGARELCPGARLRYVPNVVDVSAIEPIAALTTEPRAIFVASFFYEPNRNGLRFLLDEVFPRVWQELPQARLALVGAGLQTPPSADPRVETLGFVDQLHAAYASARCAVVPLLQGGGTPLKLIEALAHGLPVLATSRAAAGLQLRNGEDCLLADDAASFAAALVHLLREGAPQLGERGRKVAAERYSVEALAKLLEP